jgi:hypothetical protein
LFCFSQTKWGNCFVFPKFYCFSPFPKFYCFSPLALGSKGEKQLGGETKSKTCVICSQEISDTCFLVSHFFSKKKKRDRGYLACISRLSPTNSGYKKYRAAFYKRQGLLSLYLKIITHEPSLGQEHHRTGHFSES